MSAIAEKLQHCNFSLEDVREISSVQDIPRFLARFAAFTNHMSAVRQYVQNELKNLKSPTVHAEQQWLQDLEDDINFAAVMGLRHVDQHTVTIRVSNQQINMGIPVVVTASAATLSMIVKDANGNVKQESQEASPVMNPMPPPAQPSMHVQYFCDALKLTGFMTADRGFKNGFGRIPNHGPVLKKGSDLPLKAAVTAHLTNTDLLAVAELALVKLSSSLTYARSQNFIT